MKVLKTFLALCFCFALLFGLIFAGAHALLWLHSFGGEAAVFVSLLLLVILFMAIYIES
jgi:hypothetical protein